MKFHSLLFIIYFLCMHGVFAEVWFVDRDNAGLTKDGKSWSTAFTTIHEAVDAAAAEGGGDIWVAAGVYASSTNPVVTLKENVSLYGGFVGIGEGGNESELTQRSIESNVTIIDGQNKIRCVNILGRSTIDGFTIKNGLSRANPSRGGAILCSHKGKTVDITINNCTFEHNRATGYMLGGYGDGTWAVGGAIFFETSGNLQIRNSIFRSNSALGGPADGLSHAAGVPLGGAVYIGQASIINIENTKFIDNNSIGGEGLAHYAPSFGGAFAINSDIIANTFIKSCSFENNYIKGGTHKYYSRYMTGPHYTDSTPQGGALWLYNAEGIIKDCWFKRNKALSNKYTGGYFGEGNYIFGGRGGAVMVGGKCQIDFITCVFDENSVTDGGRVSSPDSILSYSSPRGGALYNYSEINIIRCKFSSNSAYSENNRIVQGGALFNEQGSTMKIENTYLYKNNINTLNGTSAGAACFNNSNATLNILNSTIIKNVAQGKTSNGAGIYANGSTKMINSIVFFNEPNQIELPSTAVPAFGYSCVMGGISGDNMLDSDPIFVNAQEDDYRLTRDSPCIDTGSSTSGLTNDFFGSGRPFDVLGVGHDGNEAFDIGAHEYAEGFPVSATILPDAAVLEGAKWRINDSDWNSSNIIVDVGVEDDYQISFSDIPGWFTPPVQTIHASEGYFACATGTYLQPTVPDVVGKMEDEAKTAIEAAMFTVGTITYESSSEIPAGQVISQSLTADSSAPIGTPIDLVVSLGPSFIVTFELNGKGTRTGGGDLEQLVVQGSAAIAPEVQANAGWVFEGWDVPFDVITSDLLVTAQYTEKHDGLGFSCGNEDGDRCGCGKNNMIKNNVQRFFCDYLMIGLSIIVLLGFNFRHKSGK